MTTPDPVTDVWELLWTAACDYRDAKPQPSEAGLIDVLMPIVTAYGDARVAAEHDRWITALGVLAGRHNMRWFALELRDAVAEVFELPEAP